MVQKSLAIALSASVLATSIAWPASAEPSVSVLEKGVYQAETVARTVIRGATGARNTVANARLISNSTLVYAQIGVRMGLRYVASDQQRGDVDLELVIRFPSPGLKNPLSGERFVESEHRVTVPVNVLQYWEYQFENDWEVISGTWEFEIWSAGKRLAVQKFCVVDVRRLNQSDSVKLCSPPVIGSAYWPMWAVVIVGVNGRSRSNATSGPACAYLPLQQFPACIGGHGIEPNEQNTQQSPALGFKRAPQPLQS